MDTKATTVTFIGESPEEASSDLFMVHQHAFNNIISFENNVGLRLNAKLVGPIHFVTKGGVGTNFIFKLPETHFPSRNVQEISLQIGFGLLVDF